MLRRLFVVLICAGALTAADQTDSSKFQPATIMAVAAHPNAPGESNDAIARYDVSVKVGNTLYVVLYTPPNGANGVEYSTGIGILVRVGTDTLTFNSRLSGSTDVPILRREVLAGPSGPDWSKLPSQYFSIKQQHLSEVLQLSEDQQAQIKPILEQEAGDAGQFLGNPALSRKDQINRWEKLVQSTDNKIKPLLSQTQLLKLQELRQEQKQQLKKPIAEQKAKKQN